MTFPLAFDQETTVANQKNPSLILIKMLNYSFSNKRIQQQWSCGAEVLDLKQAISSSV